MDNNNNNDDEYGLGSGLATFFGDFLPQNDDNSVELKFSTGLSQLPPPTIATEALIDENNGIKYAEEGLTYRQWRDTEKQNLANYLSFRIHREENQNQTDNNNSTMSYSSSSSSEYDSNNEEIEEFPMTQQSSQLESQSLMETQEPFVARQQQQQPRSTPRRKRKRKRKSIPNIQDCLHDVTKLEYLDLYTQTFGLSLSRIVKVWRLRDTKRGADMHTLIAKPVVEIWQNTSSCRSTTSTPSRRIFEEREDDGPIATAYKQVIHLEVEQIQLLSSDHPPIGGQNYNQSIRRPMHHQRIKVFFYNSYATAVSEWIQQQRKKQRQSQRNNAATVTTHTTDIVMSFSNVPAICIFPYRVDPRNWKNKEDLVEYCFCIGDESIAKHKSENIRFDSDDMEIRLMAVKKYKIENSVVTDVDAASELILSKRTLENNFLSSSEENSPEEGENGMATNTVNQNNNVFLNPLQESWNLYKNQNGNGKQNEDIGTTEKESTMTATTTAMTTTTRNRSETREQIQETHHAKTHPNPQRRGEEARTSHTEVFDVSRQPIRQQQVPPPQRQSQEDELHRQPQQRPVQPISFEGVAKQQSSTGQMKYDRLENMTDIIDRNKEAGRGRNATVNIYAAVQSLSPPKITKRGDWMITVTLIDDSCTTPVVLNIFCKEQSQLPKVVWMGDIIRVHRARVEIWKGEVQFQGLKSSSFVVVRKTEEGWKGFPSANSTFSFNRLDEERSQILWYWAKYHMKKNPSIKSEHCFTLADMLSMKDDDEKTIEDKDITVMVVEKNRYSSQPSGVLPQGFLRVWDGTGYPPSDPLFMQSSVGQSTRERRIAQSKAVERAITASQQCQESNITMEIPKTLCGRISNVVIWEKSHWNLISEHVPVGTFLRLRNVHIRKWEGNNFRSIFIHHKSWLTALPNHNFEVQSLLLRHNDRVRRCEYNLEFGLHSKFKFGGSGLSDYRNQDNVGIFTGTIHLLKVVSNNMQAILIADRSGSLKVVTGEEIRELLKNMIQMTDGSQFDSSRRYLASIRSFKVVGDDKVFVLTNLAPCE